MITSNVATTIRKYIMRTAGEMYSEKHKHIVDLTTINRTELGRLENKLKSPRIKLAHVRRMWEIYPTNGYLSERDKRYHKTHTVVYTTLGATAGTRWSRSRTWHMSVELNE